MTLSPEHTYTVSYKQISKFKNEKAFNDLWHITCAATTNINTNMFVFTWGPLCVVDMQEEKISTYEDQVVISM